MCALATLTNGWRSAASLLLPDMPAAFPGRAAYYATAQRLVDALREAISTDLSDAEEREVRALCMGRSLLTGREGRDAHRHPPARWRWGRPLVARRC
jgi:hypothetical protein